MSATDRPIYNPARRYLAIVQAPEGYPAAGSPLEAEPPNGPAPPIVHEVVLSRDYEAIRAEADALRAALAGMVDLYRHPDTGRLIVESGHSPTDDALLAAMAALGEGDE